MPMEYYKEHEKEYHGVEGDDQPVSPYAQYFNTSSLSGCIIVVLESEVPIRDNSLVMTVLKNEFLPINPRFASIMITNDYGARLWKKVNVNLKDHVKIPTFLQGEDNYETHFQEYLSELTNGKLPQNRPLWEVHLITYPTSNATSTVVLKIHHSLGDGYSLMGALFSCCQRFDDPSLPLTLPSLGTIQSRSTMSSSNQINDDERSMVSKFFNSIWDFATSLLKSTILEDGQTPIRSNVEGLELLPTTISTVTFSLAHIKQIKANLGVTVTHVIIGIIFLGTRMYMQSINKDSCHANSTALVAFNTRVVNGYQTVENMSNNVETKSLWGNQFVFLHLPIPRTVDAERMDPLEFVFCAKDIITRQRNSWGFYLVGSLLEMIRKIKGHETVARYIHRTLRNTSLIISNIIGPTEKIAFAHSHPCKGLYFMMAGAAQGLTVTTMSYMGKVRVAVGVKKSFIDQQLFISSLENAFERIFKAAVRS